MADYSIKRRMILNEKHPYKYAANYIISSVFFISADIMQHGSNEIRRIVMKDGLIQYSDFQSGWADVNLPPNAKIFVSLPMSGKDPEEVKKKMNDIFREICVYTGRLDLELIDSYTKAVPKEITDMDREAPWCLASSLKLMSFASLVIFSEDYWKARGCLAEHYICKEYGIPFTFQSMANLQMAPHNGNPGEMLAPKIDLMPKCDS